MKWLDVCCRTRNEGIVNTRPLCWAEMTCYFVLFLVFSGPNREKKFVFQGGNFIFPFFLLKEYPQAQEASFQFHPQYEFQNSMNSWKPYDYHKGISPSSSYSNFTEEIEQADDLTRISCMSPYSGNMDYMGFSGNDNIPYGGYDYPNFH